MNEYRSYLDLPLMLDAEDIKTIMSISRAGAYQLMHTEGFPVISIGKRMVVPRDKFLAWVEENTRRGVNG